MCSARTENVNSALSEALLEYYAVPGRFSLMLRQPSIAFQQLDKIILWAQGKVQEHGIASKEELQKASIFFVQRVCFRGENTHYDVLGLEREFSSEALRQRYRSLIGLTHPDKNISGLPANAAVRINKAYDVLSNEQERVAYDALLLKVTAIPQLTFPASGYSTLSTSTAVKDRLHSLVPNFKNTIFYILPLLFILFVIIMVTFEGRGAGLDLVEKKSNYSKKQDNNYTNDTSFDTKSSALTRAEVNAPVLAERVDILESSPSVFEPITSVYKNVVRSIEPLKNQNIKSEIIQVTSPTAIVVSKLDDNSEILNNFPVLKSSSSTAMLPPVLVNAPVLVSATAPAALAPASAAAPAVPASAAAATVIDTNTLRQNKSNNLEQTSDSVQPAQPSYLAEARLSLTQLISSLERPSEIDFLQSRMIRQGVSGNLFGVALPQIRDAAVIRIDQFTFHEKLDKNQLVLSGSVAYMLATRAGQLTPYRYAVFAEFKNIDKNAAMSRFELREFR